MEIWIFAIAIIVMVAVSLYNTAEFTKAIAILGMRKPEKWDSYAEKGSDQFKDECHKFFIGTERYNMANVCTYLRVLERKGLHLELVKDSTVRYKPVEGKYLGSEAWQDKWTRIVFSPSISGKSFCQCIRIIMSAHNFSEFDNDVKPKVKGLDGMIKEKDSYFIYRALYIMRYNIVIKENDSTLKDYEVANDKVLFERIKPTTVFCYPKDETCVSRKISELATVKLGCEIYASYIKSVGDYPKIIYLENIASGNSGLMYRSGLNVYDGNIILGLKSPFDIRIIDERAVIAENIVSIDITDNAISCEYLFLFLKLMCHRLNINKADEIKVDSLNKYEIIVVPAHIQREIIKKGMPVKDDAEQLEAVFSSYNEVYPMLRLVSK